MRGRAFLWIVASAALAGCGDASVSEPQGLGIEAASYLGYALDVMEFNSIRRYEIDWTSFRRTTLDDAGNARTPEETHPAIRRALERIGDNHSFFQAPGSARGDGTGGDPRAELVEPEIGYVDVTAFSGGGADADRLALVYHELIEGVDTTDVCGWVIDLRGNTGGNMWPMLAGIGPVLGEGLAGYFVDPDSVTRAWVYEDGAAGIDTLVIARADPFYDRAAGPPAVAVLTDGRTASSGEAIAVAFRGRPEARSFGSATFGVSTANTGFALPDGAVIFLTVAWMADRSGTVYGGRVEPDEAVSGTKTGLRAADAPLDAALTWLETTRCR